MNHLQAARELEQELGAKKINIFPGTNPNATVAEIKAAFYKALANLDLEAKGSLDTPPGFYPGTKEFDSPEVFQWTVS